MQHFPFPACKEKGTPECNPKCGSKRVAAEIAQICPNHSATGKNQSPSFLVPSFMWPGEWVSKQHFKKNTCVRSESD